VGGISDWLDDDLNGRLVDQAGDHAALGNAIAQVSAPAQLVRMSDGARRIAASMTVAAHLRTVEAVLERAAVREALA
jgi:hypothetical protein